MVPTHGLAQISLVVRDPERSLAFYRDVFGVEEYFRDENSIQVKGPGCWDVIAFERGSGAGKAGGIAHFGFRLTRPEDIKAAVCESERVGGTLLRRGELAPGFPFAYVAGPDGYEIEIWFE